jgi:hypothetical protein
VGNIYRSFFPVCAHWCAHLPDTWTHQTDSFPS